MNAVEIAARTLWSEDRAGGATGMEPIMGVILNRADRPCWWGEDIVGVCLAHGQFSGWFWGNVNFRKLLTANDAMYEVALVLAKAGVNNAPINRANQATHYHARSIAVPDWAKGHAACFDTPNHVFYNIGPGA